MVIFIRIRRSTKLEYTISLLDDESLICCCRHIIQLWCRIPIVLGIHMDEDCWCWWYQEVLTKDFELKIHSAIYSMLDTWMITKVALLETWWWWVLTHMMTGWYLHMLIDTDEGCPRVMIHGWYIRSCRYWCWWDGYGVFHIWYDVNDFIMLKIKRMNWYLYADISCHRLMLSTLMDIYRLLV